MKTTKTTTIEAPASSSSSSVRSNTTPNTASMEEEDRVFRATDSCYFPGCRRDTNCDCSVCLESIKSTLDLMPMSVQRTNLSKISASKPVIFVEKTPISIDPTLLSTPTSGTRPDPKPIRVFTPTPIRSTAKSVYPQGKLEPRRIERGRDSGFRVLGWTLMCLSLLLAGELGGSWLGVRVLGPPKLSSEILRKLGEESLAVEDLGQRFKVLEKGLKSFAVDGRNSSCGSKNSAWKINRDGLLLNSRCTIYKSAAEEVAIWGWPLQNAGLLTAGFSSRSLTVISGRITEWQNGGIEYLVRNANSTWVLTKWSASAVQFDPNTWIVEYKRSIFLDNPRFLSALCDFLRYRMSVFIRRARQKFWFLPSLNCQCGASLPRAGFSNIPT